MIRGDISFTLPRIISIHLGRFFGNGFFNLKACLMFRTLVSDEAAVSSCGSKKTLPVHTR